VPALDKLARVFAGIAAWKAGERQFVLRLLEVWTSDDNAIVREKFRRRLVTTMTPLFARIIEQGAAEGTFDTTSPVDTARVLVSLLQGMNDAATELFIAYHAGSVSLEQMEAHLTGYAKAFDRILGIPSGTAPLFDPSVLRDWL
jgi:hypothetical protein